MAWLGEPHAPQTTCRKVQSGGCVPRAPRKWGCLHTETSRVRRGSWGEGRKREPKLGRVKGYQRKILLSSRLWWAQDWPVPCACRPRLQLRRAPCELRQAKVFFPTGKRKLLNVFPRRSTKPNTTGQRDKDICQETKMNSRKDWQHEDAHTDLVYTSMFFEMLRTRPCPQQLRQVEQT